MVERQHSLEHELELRQLQVAKQAQELEMQEKIHQSELLLTKNHERTKRLHSVQDWVTDVNNSRGLTPDNPGVPGRQVSFEQDTQPQPHLQVTNEQLVNSGANILTHMGLDNNTMQFIASQAVRANGFVWGSVGLNTSHATASQLNEQLTALDSLVSDRRDMAGGEPSNSRQPAMMTASGFPPAAVGGPSSAAVVEGSGVNVSAQAMGRLSQFMRGNLGHVAGDRESDDESSVSQSQVKLKNKVQLGMVAKQVDNIKSQEVWPHYNLTFGFVTARVQFHQISFDQYVVGEMKTIMNSKDPIEIRGQLALMSRLGYLKHRGYVWPNLRTLYAANVNSIERHEDTWASDWRYIEDMVLEPPERKGEKGAQKGGVAKSSEQWYCRNYNRPEGCDLQSPHEAQVGRRRRRVKHFCAKCYLEGGQAREHSEMDAECLHHTA